MFKNLPAGKVKKKVQFKVNKSPCLIHITNLATIDRKRSPKVVWGKATQVLRSHKEFAKSGRNTNCNLGFLVAY